MKAMPIEEQVKLAMFYLRTDWEGKTECEYCQSPLRYVARRQCPDTIEHTMHIEPCLPCEKLKLPGKDIVITLVDRKEL